MSRPGKLKARDAGHLQMAKAYTIKALEFEALAHEGGSIGQFAHLMQLPTWLPPPVRSHVLLVEKLFAGLETDLAILRRLSTDSRMRYVWRVLVHREATDRALVEFFDCAFQRARFPHFVTTPKDRAALAAAWTRTAKACRQSSFIEQYNPKLSAALVLAADYFEEIARREGNTDSPLVVKRHRGDGHHRAYVRVLGNLTRRLFGNSLYRTVATTASVALQQDIDWQQVREWLKS
jgi:hypothetical protein